MVFFRIMMNILALDISEGNDLAIKIAFCWNFSNYADDKFSLFMYWNLYQAMWMIFS